MALQIHELFEEGYEKILEVIDSEVDLHAFLILHNTKLGPAIGGIRIYPYSSRENALIDGLRLAKGMTYKSALADTHTGGGKSVIIAPNDKPQPEARLKAFAEVINSLKGKYHGGADLGIRQQDLKILNQYTPYILGIQKQGSSGDPCPFTGWGGYKGIEAVCQHLWRKDSPENLTIAIQGVGGVGHQLANYLFWHGANLIICDVNTEAAELCAQGTGAKIVSPEEIYGVECDIFAPCAVGATINPQTVPQLKCRAVAGLANNQLLSLQDGESLRKRNILYAPDFVINAGGLINVSFEMHPNGYNAKLSLQKINQIYHHLLEIFSLSQQKNVSTYQIAVEMAEEKVFASSLA